jgi:GDPmannose 4,6-dehydratase
LAEFLLNKGYEVHGIKRCASLLNTDRIDHLSLDLHESGRQFTLHYGDLTDSTGLVPSSSKCSRRRSTTSACRAMWR